MARPRLTEMPHTYGVRAAKAPVRGTEQVAQGWAAARQVESDLHAGVVEKLAFVDWEVGIDALDGGFEDDGHTCRVGRCLSLAGGCYRGDMASGGTTQRRRQERKESQKMSCHESMNREKRGIKRPALDAERMVRRYQTMP